MPALWCWSGRVGKRRGETDNSLQTTGHIDLFIREANVPVTLVFATTSYIPHCRTEELTLNMTSSEDKPQQSSIQRNLGLKEKKGPLSCV